jgi:uncharacterized protein YndB with AHSA1/START domain
MTTQAEPEVHGRASVTINRLMDAPVDLMWRVWTEPEHLAAWWGPTVFTNPVCEVDLRVGGRMHIIMRAPDGFEHAADAVFEEIDPPNLLVWTMDAVSLTGETLLKSRTTVTLKAEGGKTRLIIVSEAYGVVPEAVQMLAGMDAGWNQSIDKLADHIAVL